MSVEFAIRKDKINLIIIILEKNYLCCSFFKIRNKRYYSINRDILYVIKFYQEGDIRCFKSFILLSSKYCLSLCIFYNKYPKDSRYIEKAI